MLSGAVVAWLASTALPPGIPPVIFPALLIVVGALVGMACGLIPALLNIKWKANVVVVTIMLNYVLTFASTYILRYWMRDTSVTYLGSTSLLRMQAAYPLRGTDLHRHFHCYSCPIHWWFLNRTTKGFEIRVTEALQNMWE